MSTRPSTAITEPPRNAAWKPSLSAFGSAAGSPPELATRSSVREVAIVASTASPSAPPICCEVLISPLASPASCSATPDIAAIVVVTKANPRPVAASSDGPRMSLTKLPPTDTCENQARAAAISTIPVASTGLKPTRVTSCEAIPDAAMIVSASGR